MKLNSHYPQHSSRHTLMTKTAISQNPLEAAQVLCTQGIEHGAKGEHEEALGLYTQVISKFGNRRNVDFLNVLATAMFNTGTTLSALNRDEEAVAAYDALIKKFDQTKLARFDVFIVKAMMNKAYRLNTLQRNDDAIASYQAVVTQFGRTNDTEMQPLVDSVKVFLVERKAVLAARDRAV